MNKLAILPAFAALVAFTVVPLANAAGRGMDSKMETQHKEDHKGDSTDRHDKGDTRDHLDKTDHGKDNSPSGN